MVQTHQTIAEKRSLSPSATPPPSETKKTRSDSPAEVKVGKEDVSEEHGESPLSQKKESEVKSLEQLVNEGKEKQQEQEGDTLDDRPSPSRPGQLPPAVFGDVGEAEAERKHGVLEEGHIYFLYRPTMDTEEPHSLAEVSRFNILLVPSDPAGAYRLIVVGRKRLPTPATGKKGRVEVLWGEVTAVGERLSELKVILGESSYQTKTRGTRTTPAARVAGCGAYLLHSMRASGIPENSRNYSAIYRTYLAYSLTLPHELGEVQEELNIEHEGAFQLQVKNPSAHSSNERVRDQPEYRQPKFPPILNKYFTTKFIPVNPVSMLNYAGAELLFIPGHRTTAEEIGAEAEHELKELAEHEVEELVKDEDQDDGGEEGHAEAKAALKQLGLDSVLSGKALEGYWE